MDTPLGARDVAAVFAVIPTITLACSVLGAKAVAGAVDLVYAGGARPVGAVNTGEARITETASLEAEAVPAAVVDAVPGKKGRRGGGEAEKGSQSVGVLQRW